MNILITGAAGFIGSHTAERLASLGHHVVGVDNFSDYYDPKLKRQNAKDLAAKGVQVLEVELCDKGSMSQMSNDFHYIFHFAAQPGIAAQVTFEDYLKNNVLATKSVLDFAQTCPNLKLFINIGTSSIYGLEAVSPESVAPQPASFYGVTKLAAEQLALQLSRENKLMACSLRLYSVIGPRERPEKLFTKLIAAGIEGNAFPLFEGSQLHLRSFTYVGDIVDGIVSVIGKEATVNGEVINLGTEKEYSTQQGIEAVEAVLNVKIQMDINPKRRGDQDRTKAVIDKARRLLNYNPHTTLLEAVKAQVDWFKNL
ncbi:MAG: NAD-dependent epimerase/dehydratase family protein [Bacteroidetes bacterium]|nr:NAD-dependent epimerase/dehydratase family protein [Bacteroidota bacterium]MDA0879821.1 NAD-dependent epimerase/dehydratase family protein [Bacteroidota bacterium]MDA1115809.1 NAD-dependent epimerase/dehydratase family protein [Bacteroidota bacterium]